LTLGKIADFGCPIILLRVDVEMKIIRPSHAARLTIGIARFPQFYSRIGFFMSSDL